MKYLSTWFTEGKLYKWIVKNSVASIIWLLYIKEPILLGVLEKGVVLKIFIQVEDLTNCQKGAESLSMTVKIDELKWFRGNYKYFE